MQQREILIKSTMDGTMQPSLFYKSESKEKRPLLDPILNFQIRTMDECFRSLQDIRAFCS